MKYTFFWSGPFSQWYKSNFVVDGIIFNCAEQYMMYKKAMLFNDIEMANKILFTSNPRDQKAMGRLIKNFDITIWNENAKTIVYEGNLAKFSQNPRLNRILLQTANTLLVEASPNDAIWGIGIDEDTAKNTPEEQWPGTNWLGEILTKIREDICK